MFVFTGLKENVSCFGIADGQTLGWQQKQLNLNYDTYNLSYKKLSLYAYGFWHTYVSPANSQSILGLM